MSAHARKEKLNKAYRTIDHLTAQRDGLLAMVADLTTKLNSYRQVPFGDNLPGCPTCGMEDPIEDGGGLVFCPNCGTTATAVMWSQRPREDRLREEIYRLQSLIADCSGVPVLESEYGGEG